MSAKKLIENEAINDYRMGLPPDATRHGNLSGFNSRGLVQCKVP